MSNKVQVECPYCAEEDFQHDDVGVKCWKCGGEYRTKLNLSPKQTSALYARCRDCGAGEVYEGRIVRKMKHDTCTLCAQKQQKKVGNK